MPRKKTNIPANETPEARFVRVANERVNRILTGLKNLGTLGGSSYASKAEQRTQIKTALETALGKCMESMSKDGTTPAEFKLK